MLGSKKKTLIIIFMLLSFILLAGCTAGNKEPAEQTPPAQTEKPQQSVNNNEEPKENTTKIILTEIKKLARQGKTINCEFPVETTVIDTVINKWGQPDKSEYIAEAKGTYATFSERKVVFGFNKGSQIFDVRSYDERLQQITLSQVKESLGIPDNIHQYANEDMLVYNVGDKYQLLFMFPKADQQNADPRLDHYNLFYPRGTVNMMADDPGIKY
jgi:hypothetical protein